MHSLVLVDLYSADKMLKPGLSVHMNQVHKETLNSVDNALPNRAGLDVEIFGMEGIPEDVIASHNNRVIQQFYEAEADRRKTSGNPAPGSNTDSSGQKKPKVEQPSDLKKRLAEHKAKKAALQADGNSGNATPLGAGQAASPPTGQNVSSLVSKIVFITYLSIDSFVSACSGIAIWLQHHIAQRHTW